MKDFKDLTVWQKAHSLANKIYRVTSMFPREELYGLTSQIRRSCVSVPANIAEGCGRNTDIELARFLEISMGSASELEYLLLLTSDLNILDATDHRDLNNDVVEIKCMLASLIKMREGRVKPALYSTSMLFNNLTKRMD